MWQIDDLVGTGIHDRRRIAAVRHDQDIDLVACAQLRIRGRKPEAVAPGQRKLDRRLEHGGIAKHSRCRTRDLRPMDGQSCSKREPVIGRATQQLRERIRCGPEAQAVEECVVGTVGNAAFSQEPHPYPSRTFRRAAGVRR